jgi:hypothetical protein
VLDASTVFACGNAKRSIVIVQWNRGYCRDKSIMKYLLHAIMSCLALSHQCFSKWPFTQAVRTPFKTALE